MNFNSHRIKLFEGIEIALDKDKVEMIASFQFILGNAGSLFKTDRFEFWLRQIGQIEAVELPVTHFGLSNARDSLNGLRGGDLKNIESVLFGICEDLFTFSMSGDMCIAQGDYHYYYNETQDLFFKESTLGFLEPDVKMNESDVIRIAKKSELDNKDESLFYS